jgi:hypothetical protein
MTHEKTHAASGAGAAFAPATAQAEQAEAAGHYTVEFIDAEGVLQWREEFPNVVCTPGKNFALDTFLAGSAYTAAWFLGLIGNTGYSAVAAADTMASHAGWTESSTYSAGTRPAVSWAAASAGSKASTTVSYSTNGVDTIKGVFLTTNSTKGGTTGTLYSAGLFSGGDQPVTGGGTLNVTYTASL